MMSENLQQRGLPQMELPLTQSVVVSHVKTYRSLETERAWRATEAVFSVNTTDLLASLDQGLSSWKTSRLCFIGGGTDVLRAFAARGYDVWWETISAEALGFPHERERVWLLAYSDQIGRKACTRVQALIVGEKMPWTAWQSMELRRTRSGGTRWIPNGIVCSVDNGLSADMDGIGAAGNAVVPQIPELLGLAIKAALQSEADIQTIGELA